MLEIAIIAESIFGAGEKFPLPTVLTYFGVPNTFTERERSDSFCLAQYAPLLLVALKRQCVMAEQCAQETS